MRLSLELSAAANVIRAYAEGLVTINDHHIRQSVIVIPDRLITDWPPQHFDELASSHFQALVELNLEIVLLGTGKHQQFPSPRLTHPLLSRGVGLEIMDTDGQRFGDMDRVEMIMQSVLRGLKDNNAALVYQVCQLCK